MDWIPFLLRAKLHTYANGGGTGTILPDGFKELTFKEGDWFYRDRYYGNNPFIGEEIVFYLGKGIYAMNYFGGVIVQDAEVSEIYTFLQAAMRHVTPDRPYRGPQKFVMGDFNYQDENTGSPHLFSGEEKIYLRNRLVYSLVYHGGGL